VSAEAIYLDHPTSGTPEEVDEERADADVHLGARQTMTAAESEEAALQLAPRVIWLEQLAYREA
jgi:hypothetical protein